jgi:hypothetical protein
MNIAYNAPEVTGNQPAAAPAGTPPPPPGTAPLAPPPGYVPVTVFQTRVDELTAQRHAAQRQLEEMQSTLVQAQAKLQAVMLGQTPPAAAGTDPNAAPAAAPARPALNREITEEVINRQVEERAAAVLSEREFDNRCNEAAEAGKKTYGDEFQQSVSTLQALGLMQKGFLEAALETGEAAKVIHALGKDPEQAQKIARMKGPAQAVALAKLAVGLLNPLPLSGAPAPITTLNGASAGAGATPGAPSAGDDMANWMAKRNAEVQARARR